MISRYLGSGWGCDWVEGEADAPWYVRTIRGDVELMVGGVAVEAGEFGALYGAFAEDEGEVLLIHQQDVAAGEGEDFGTREEFFYGCDGGPGVVRADFLTNVAPVDAAAERNAVGQDGVAALDGEE